jgi:hypothetical protein
VKVDVLEGTVWVDVEVASVNTIWGVSVPGEVSEMDGFIPLHAPRRRNCIRRIIILFKAVR